MLSIYAGRFSDKQINMTREKKRVHDQKELDFTLERKEKDSKDLEKKEKFLTPKTPGKDLSEIEIRTTCSKKDKGGDSSDSLRQENSLKKVDQNKEKKGGNPAHDKLYPKLALSGANYSCSKAKLIEPEAQKLSQSKSLKKFIESGTIEQQLFDNFLINEKFQDNKSDLHELQQTGRNIPQNSTSEVDLMRKEMGSNKASAKSNLLPQTLSHSSSESKRTVTPNGKEKKQQLLQRQEDDSEKNDVSTEDLNCSSHRIQLSEVDEESLLACVNKWLSVEKVIIKTKQVIKSNRQGMIEIFKEYVGLLPDTNIEKLVKKVFSADEETKIVGRMMVIESAVLFLVLYICLDDTENKIIENIILKMLDIIHQSLLNFLSIISKSAILQSPKFSENLKEIKKILRKLNADEPFKEINSLDKNNESLLLALLDLIEHYEAEEEEPFSTINYIISVIDQIDVESANHLMMESFTAVFLSFDKSKLQSKARSNQGLGTKTHEEKGPYLEPLSVEKSEKKYTLVVDLDETLVHYEELSENQGQFLVRPFTNFFLEEMSNYYEIVIFTAALQEYADFILDKIDRGNVISHRLYRQHAVPNGPGFVKDLEKLGRDMKKVIIIDNMPDNFSLQPNNGIFIKSWTGEEDDRALADLAPLLKEIVIKKFSDVRVALKMFRDQMAENIERGIENPHMYLKLDNPETSADDEKNWES